MDRVVLYNIVLNREIIIPFFVCINLMHHLFIKIVPNFVIEFNDLKNKFGMIK